MKVILFGNMNEWEKAITLLIKNRTDIVIWGLSSVDAEELSKRNESVYTLEQSIEAYKSGEVDAIVNIDASLPIWNEYLYKNGVERNYAIPTGFYQKKELQEADKEEILKPWGCIAPELHNLEFQLADHCNLKCKGCTHFSNLVKEPVFADFGQFEKDLKRLRELFENVKEFYLLGGEPLLNQNATEFLYITKQYFPYTKNILVSNGLLVLSMKQEMIDALKSTETKLSISNYDCLDEERIHTFLQQQGVEYELRNGKQFFTKFLSKKADDNIQDVFNKCARRNCTYLDKGRIAACTQPFTIRYFNDYFKEDFSEEGAIDLYEEGLSGYRVLERLNQPMGACKNCTYDEAFTWEMTKDHAKLSDWCVK